MPETDPIARLTAALAGRYRIQRSLGEGGMATVHLADDLKHHRQVAIKVFRPDLAAMLGAERFLREITTTANLRHPHILPLYDSGEAAGSLFYVMPFVEGESLRGRLNRERQLLRTDVAAAGYGDLIGVRVNGDTTPVPLVASGYSEMHPTVSPNGRRLAYRSNESGQNEVYVRPFPRTAGGRWQISTDGGWSPVWAPDGTQLFYLDGATRLVAAQLSPGGAFAVVGRRSLFDASAFALDLYHQAFDVTPDGRFLFLRPRGVAAGPRGQRIVWVYNWFTDVQAKLAGGR